MINNSIPERPVQIDQDQDVYDDGYFRIEHNSYYAAIDGSVLLLSRTEFFILSGLARRIGRVVPSNVLWNYAWGKDKPFNSVALRVHVSNLRRKILPYGLGIRSMAAVGYRLDQSRRSRIAS
jgi:DNA-binding response OmpR family regulator